MTVDEFTSPLSVTASPTDSLEELMNLMETKGIRHLPIVKGGKAIGIVSDRDLRFAFFIDKARQGLAEEVMTPEPYSVNRNDSIEDVAFELSKRKIGSALVEDENGELYGIFTSTDALNALIEIVRSRTK